MSASNYLENKISDHLWRGRAYTAPATLYLALFTSDPGETGSLTGEPGSGSYARVAITPNDSNFKGTGGETSGASAGTGGQSVSGAAFQFPTASGSWGTLTHWALMDASSAGNVLVSDAL